MAQVIGTHKHFDRLEAGPDRAANASVIRMVGQSPEMLQVFEQIRRAAVSDCSVVISGESGTGKELVAAALHGFSRRASGPFVDVNTAAIPESLVESELFGHVKGAYTGATSDRTGRFEAANGGTLFIDEIGDFALTSQAKLLRTLETHRVTPVGTNHDHEVDVRVIAATNCPLEEIVEDGRFRADLYYRLNVVTIFLPPLRERKSDIAVLIEYFLEQLSESLQRPVPKIEQKLMDYMLAHEWPGNVRQLRNCLESMLVLSDAPVLTFEDLPRRLFLQKPQGCQLRIPMNMSLEQLEKSAIEQALNHFNNRSRAARSLGISVRTLQRKLKEWDHDSLAAEEE